MNTVEPLIAAKSVYFAETKQNEIKFSEHVLWRHFSIESIVHRRALFLRVTLDGAQFTSSYLLHVFPTRSKCTHFYHFKLWRSYHYGATIYAAQFDLFMKLFKYLYWNRRLFKSSSAIKRTMIQLHSFNCGTCYQRHLYLRQMRQKKQKKWKRHRIKAYASESKSKTSL